MIEEMKKISIFTLPDYKKRVLKFLREAGVIHIDSTLSSPSDESLCLAKELRQLNLLLNKLSDISQQQKKSKAPAELPIKFKGLFADFINDFIQKKFNKNKDEAQNFVKNITLDVQNADIDKIEQLCSKLIERQNELKAEQIELKKNIDNAKVWGSIDTSLLKDIQNKVEIRFAIADIKILKTLKNTNYIVLSHKNKSEVLIAIPGVADESEVDSLRLYTSTGKSLNQMQDDYGSNESELKNIYDSLCVLSSCISRIKDDIVKKSRDAEFLAASDSFSLDAEQGKICYLSGYIPTEKTPGFKAKSQDSKEFAYLISDVTESDNPPTLLKNKGYSSMLAPVMGLLGLQPGYRERDISFWFLSFFAIFFAIIIGDGAYGLIFLALGAVLAIKQKKKVGANKSLPLLLLFLGGCTTIWGAITGTWFASEAVLNLMPFLKTLVIPKLATFNSMYGLSPTVSQNAIMRLCFSLGAVQLGVACILNVVNKVKNKDISLVADLGWFSIIASLYFLVLYLLIAGPLESMVLRKYSSLIVFAILLGFLLIVVFGGQKPNQSFSKGLKEGGKNAFTTFLNVVSSFGNIMSYIRLFAVGMASVAIAQSFNSIASPMLSGAVAPLGILVLFIGHALNLVMGLLSVIVHGVRLNVMEFSNQLGQEWSGYDYHPFK